MSGSYYSTNHLASGSGRTDYSDPKANFLEDLWDRMYIRPKTVIIQCGHCASHNAICNSTCVQCGAPMGYGIVKQYA